MILLPDVVDVLLKKTESGPVTEWVERLAAVARRAELPLCNIEWYGSPKQVAHSIAGYSFRYYGCHSRLLELIEA